MSTERWSKILSASILTLLFGSGIAVTGIRLGLRPSAAICLAIALMHPFTRLFRPERGMLFHEDPGAVIYEAWGSQGLNVFAAVWAAGFGLVALWLQMSSQ